MRLFPLGVGVLTFGVLFWHLDHNDRAGAEERSAEVFDAKRPENEGPGLVSESDFAAMPSVTATAIDFPHNLKTFDAWQNLDATQMAGFQISLVSRVGRWQPSAIADFFLRVHGQITDPTSQQLFQRAVLGSWCAKDVEHCLATLEENLPAAQANTAKRNALAGWARQDWMIALRYLHRHGDLRIEARLGGDCSGYVRNLVAAVAQEHGAEEGRGVLAQMSSKHNISAGRLGLETIAIQ